MLEVVGKKKYKVPITQAYRVVNDPLATTCCRKKGIPQDVGKDLARTVVVASTLLRLLSIFPNIKGNRGKVLATKTIKK